MTEVQLFERTLEWLKDNYGRFRFFAERVTCPDSSDYIKSQSRRCSKK